METSGVDAESKSTVSEIEIKPEKIEDIHQEGPSFTCDLCDKELTYKIAQDLLSGLATACVDGTTGVLFKTPASVAADFRKEMVDYLTVRSENFVAETVVLDTDPGAEVSDHPLDILSNMIDDYAVSRKSLFSRVSGLMLSETREERIDEFVQEMERDSFWLLDRRESVAQNLIKNVDFKSLHHCNVKFGSENEVMEHQETCGYRAVMCENQGCNDTFSADSIEHHDSICPFKILPCEQNCSELLMRRDMDKHCITDCAMKLTNCPFYSIGCSSPVPHSLIKKHCSEYTHGHLINVLQYIHKEASSEDAERWAEQIEKSEFSDQLEARDVRTFTMAVKDIEKRIGPFQVSQPETIEETPSAPPSEQATNSPPEQTTATTPPTDQPVAPPPSKERESPSLKAPEQDVTPITTHNETIEETPPAPPSEQATNAPPEQTGATTPTDQPVAPPPSKERESPSLKASEQDVTPITTQNEAEITPPNQEPSLSTVQDLAHPTTAQTDTKSSPPEQTTATTPPTDQPVAPPPSMERELPSLKAPEQDATPMTTQIETETTPPNQGPAPPTTTTAQTDAETTPPN